MNLKRRLACYLGEGIHTCLRKCLQSDESHVVWDGINKLPDKEWYTVCETVAEGIINNFIKGNSSGRSSTG